MILLTLGVLALGRWWQAALWVAAVAALSTGMSAMLAPSVDYGQLALIGATNLAVGAAIGGVAFLLKKAWLNYKMPKKRRPGPAGQR